MTRPRRSTRGEVAEVERLRELLAERFPDGVDVEQERRPGIRGTAAPIDRESTEPDST